MKIRIMGTREECAAFTKLVRETVPKKNIRSISEFYPNVRKCAYSNEGRVYMDFEGVITESKANDKRHYCVLYPLCEQD